MSRVRPVRSTSGSPFIVRARGLSEVTDADLVRRALDGDAWAQETLFRRHVGFISALVTRVLGRSDEVGDVVQDTFIAALDGLSRFQGTASFKSWLAGIAVHKVHRVFRRRKLLAFLGLHRSSHDAMLEASARADAPLEAREDLRRLDEILRTLSDVDRMAWVLRYVEGYSLEETAALCATSLTTVKRRIARVHGVVRSQVHIEEVEDA